MVDTTGMNKPCTNYNRDKIQTLMENKGWSWAELGKRAGFGGNGTIHTVRHNSEVIDGEEIWMTPKTAKAVAKALRVSIDRLIIETEEGEVKK